MPLQTVSSRVANQQRGFSTSARASAKHDAETYQKEVDKNKPTNTKVHQVDSSAEGATVARANEQPVTGEFSRLGPDSPEYKTVSANNFEGRRDGCSHVPDPSPGQQT